MVEYNYSQTLTEIIDPTTLQQLQDSIANEINITTIILDPTGQPITQMSNPRQICNLLGDHYSSGGVCTRTHEYLNQTALDTRMAVASACTFSGLTSMAVPIFFGDTFVGSWIIGQIRFEDDFQEGFMENIHKLGILNTASPHPLSEIPVFSRAKFNAILGLMTVITEEIVSLAANLIEIDRKNKQLTMLAENYSSASESLQTAAETSEIYIYLTDFYTGEILVCNDGYAQLFQKTCAELIGTPCYKNFGFDSRCSFCPHERLIDEKKLPLSPLAWEHHFAESNTFYQVTSRAVRWVDGRLAKLSVSVDITHRKLLENKLFNLAFFDQILELPNYERMEQDMKEGQRYDYLIAVNLSDLGRINNVFGRACGNSLLKEIRDFILQMNIPNSALYRGKVADFSILIQCQHKDDQLIRKIAHRIYNRCKKSWMIELNDHRQNIFASVNVCILPMEGQNKNFIDYLYSALEHSLDLAEKMDGIVIYDSDSSLKFNDGQKLELSLRNAVRDNMNGFSVVYHPIIGVKTTRWCGVEAVCRWNSPDMGPVPPNIFIPVAETSGLIGIIGEWVLEHAIAQMKALDLDLVENFLLEVNLSPLQLTASNIDQTIMEILSKHNYPPQKLGLEITESNKLNFTKRTIDAITRLSELGVIVILDDFGAGYPSFNTLHKLPVKMLKTDRSFILGLEGDRHIQKLISVMVALAHGSNMTIVMEGVENDYQAQYLMRQGVDFFQGYFFARPLTALQLAEKLDNFHNSMEGLLPFGYSSWHTTVLNESAPPAAKSDWPPSLYRLLDRCIKESFVNPDSYKTIDILLGLVGNGLLISRGYVFVQETDGTFSNTNEWCAPGIASQMEYLRHVSFRTLFSLVAAANPLEVEGFLKNPSVLTLDEDGRDELSRPRAKVIVTYPIWKNNELYGFVGFDDCSGDHQWTKEELQMLYTFTSLISSALKAMRQLHDDLA